MERYITQRTPTTMFNTESIIIFPLVKNGKQFNSRLYTLAVTNGKVSNQEIDEVLTQLIMTAEDASLSEHVPNGRLYCILLIIFLGVAALYMLLSDFSYLSREILGFVGTFLCIGFLSTCVCRYSTLKREVRLRMFKECQELIDEYNEYFVNKGLSWHLPKEFPQWVELWKDYKLEGFRGENQDVIPFGNHENNEEKDGDDVERGLFKEYFGVENEDGSR